MTMTRRRPHGPPPPRPGRWTYQPHTRSVTIYKRHTNHWVHALLTLFTGGLWAPIWIKISYQNQAHQRKRTTRYYWN
jgi:hypothetical protein